MAYANDQSFYNQNSVLRISVMVVDDDPIFLQVMSRMLEKCKYKDPSIMEITVLVARDSMEALSTLKIHRNSIDLIITDYYMPGMNGIQLKKQITQEFGNLPVIVMSSDTNKEEESLTCGAMCFIQKPIKPNDLTKIYEYAITYKRNGKSIVLTTEQNHKETADVNVPQQIETVPDVSNVMVETKKKKKKKHSSGGSDSKSVNTNGSCVSTDSSRKNRKRKPNGNDDDDDKPPASKKNKVTWTDELHDLFLQAIRHIGLDKAVPKKILEFMNIPQLTRENIASHLQKYRIFLRKVSDQGLRHSSLVPIRSRQSYYTSYYTPSTSWYETSLNNRSFYTKPRHGLGQSRLLSNTSFNHTSPYSYMNRSSTYEPRRVGSNLTLPIRSNLSITNQPSQTEGRSSLLESSMMANKTAQASPVIGFGSQHGTSAINGDSLNNDMVSSYGSLTPTQPGLGSYGSSSLVQPGLSSVARLRPSQTRVTSFECLISNQPGVRSLGSSTPNQAGLSNYGSLTPNQPIVDSFGSSTPNQLVVASSGSSTPNQLVVASFGSSTPNQAGLINHGSLTPNQPIVDSFGSSTPNQLVVATFGSSTPNQSRVSSFGSLTPSQPGLSSYGTLTSNQSGVSSYGSLTPNQAGLGSYGSLTPNQSGSITPNQSGVSSFGSLTPNQSGVSSFGSLTPNQPGLSSFGSLTTNQSGVSSFGRLTPNQSGLSSFGSLTPNRSGLFSFGSLTPNQPGLGSFEGLTFNEPGSSSFSFGLQSFLNNEDEADKLPQPHANTNTQPNLDIPQLENLNIFDDLGSISELPFDTNSFLFDQNKQQEALDSINFDLPDLPTQLNQTCPLVEDIGGDWTFVNIDQDHFIGEASNNFVVPETDFPNFNMNPTQNQEPDGSDFIDWSFLDRQDLVGDDFMDSVFNNDMD